MLTYQSNGCLVPGIQEMDWQSFVDEFGFNDHRKKLITGLELALSHLKACGCKAVYIDGSFVSRKEKPADYDVCYDISGMSMAYLKARYPKLVDFSKGRINQKINYGGEFFPATELASPPKEIYLDFFQKDRDGNAKGVVKLSIS